MVEELLRTEIHDMSERIYDLQNKTEHLTNGQRYAVVSEIEKSEQILRNDLRHLEHQLYTQKTHDEKLKKDIELIEKQINDFGNIKSDLIARINTETEHTRKEMNDKIISFMSQELMPIKKSIEDNQQDIASIKKDITSLRFEIKEYESDQKIKEVARYDHLKLILAGIIGSVTAISVLSSWLEPSIRTLMQIFL